MTPMAVAQGTETISAHVPVTRSDSRKEPLSWLVAVFALGAAGKLATAWVEARVSRWTGFDIKVETSGAADALLYLFLFVAPVQELAKVAAMWPAFRSKHFNEPVDGVVYSSTAALGFGFVGLLEVGLGLHGPTAGLEVVRALLALPAHVFFAAAWGYALGRTRRGQEPGPLFPLAWMAATALHGLYAHLAYARGAAAMAGTVPLLALMGTLSILALRDLGARADRTGGSNWLERVSLAYVPRPPSLSAVREAFSKEDQPLGVGWIAFGVLVTVGAVLSSLVLTVGFARAMHVDFSLGDDLDIRSATPVALLGSGVLFAFFLSGLVVARASGLPTLLEPVAATGLALALFLTLFAMVSSLALVVVLAFSPIAWGLACVGAWIGRKR